MNVSFTNKQEKYIADQIDSGDFQNASEVVRDALRLHQFYRHKVLDDLKSAIEQGWEGPASTEQFRIFYNLKSFRKLLSEF